MLKLSDWIAKTFAAPRPHRTTYLRWAKQGEIPVVKIGGKWFVKEDAVGAWWAAKSSPPGDAEGAADALVRHVLATTPRRAHS